MGLPTYQQTIDYLYTRLPMFSRIGKAALKPDLTNTIKLCEALDNPHTKIKSVHIAGTNGKGSTSHGLAAVMQHAGYKTGLYTSPHLVDFRERIRINGTPVSKEWVVNFVAQHKNLIEQINPSFFEITVAMAFTAFAEEKVDIAIIETGLGGRLDSTNVITPLLSIITNISYDHKDLLGNTLAEIATEKAGIIKKNVPLVIGEQHEETERIYFRGICFVRLYDLFWQAAFCRSRSFVNNSCVIGCRCFGVHWLIIAAAIITCSEVYFEAASLVYRRCGCIGIFKKKE